MAPGAWRARLPTSGAAGSRCPQLGTHCDRRVRRRTSTCAFEAGYVDRATADAGSSPRPPSAGAIADALAANGETVVSPSLGATESGGEAAKKPHAAYLIDARSS